MPVALLDTIIAVLGTLGRAFPPLAEKAELARIGRYYATESMLVFDPAIGRYDAVRHAIGRFGNAVRFLRAPDQGRGLDRPGRPRGVLMVALRIQEIADRRTPEATCAPGVYKMSDLREIRPSRSRVCTAVRANLRRQPFLQLEGASNILQPPHFLSPSACC